MCAIPLLFAAFGLVCAYGSFIPAAGNALRFNGDKTHRHYISITPKCQADGNPFNQANLTLAVWFRTSSLTSVEQTLIGYAFAGGPQIGLERDGRAHFQGVPVLPPTCWVYMDQSMSLADGEWHHLALSSGPEYFGFYVDGRVQINCTGALGITPRTDKIIMGVYDPSLNSANSQSFTGDIDDVRIYKRLFLTEDELFRDVTSRPPTSTELNQDLLVALNFDGNDIVNQANLPASVDLGGGLLQRSPKLVPSSAPIYSATVNGTLIIDAVQDATASYAPVVRQKLLASTPRFGTTTPPPESVHIVVLDVEIVSGAISIDNTTLIPGLTLSGLSDPEIVFQPVLNAVGNEIAKFSANITIGQFTQLVIVAVNSRANWRPIAGGSGNAAKFDGVDDFYMAEHLAWPQKQVMVNGVMKNGLSAITIEFWCWVDESSAGDTAVFALGGNTEMSQPWVDQFNRLRKSGRWHITLPDGTGSTVWMVDDSTFKTSTKPFYSGWAHYAFVHDGIEGTNVAIYMNGELVFSGTHDHDGSQNGLLDFNHVTIGTWTFWSEVYHRGIIDDFRLWNYSRSGSEIQQDRFRQLTGSEPNLFAYWSFDSDSDGTVVDHTRRGNDLKAGGCVSCEPRFYCQPYHPDPITLGPDSCIPSAKSQDSPYFRTNTCFGGTHCFKGDESVSTRPTLVPSEAPIGGHTFEQHSIGGQAAEVVLNGTDADGDALLFSIDALPERGSLQYKAANGDWISINTVPFMLPTGVRTVRLQSAVGDGGHPFANVQYTVFDGIVHSTPIRVPISLVCPRGSFLNSATYHCDLCQPGSYSNEENMDPACALCAVNEYQANPGQTFCFKCTPGMNYAATPGSATCALCNSTDIASNQDLMTLSTSFCALDMMIDNEFSIKGGRRSEMSFAGLLPSGLDPAHARVILTTIPQYGKLYQLGNDGDLVENFYDYFFSSVDIQEQWVASVVSASSYLPDRNYNATIGQSDVVRAGSSPRAWAAFDGDNGIADITVRFDEALYMTGIVIYENIGGGAVTKIEALMPSGEFTVIWTGDPLPVGLLVLRQFQPTICPTNFKTDTLRITINSLRCHGRNEIDAIKMMGSSALKKTSSMLVQNADLKVAYEAPTTTSIQGGVPLGYKVSDSISYKVQTCYGGQVVTSGVQTLQVTLGSSKVTDVFAPQAVTLTATVIAGIGIAACVLSALIIYHFRMEPIIRASSVFFMNLMLLGMASGFLVLLLTAINAADPTRIPNFCMIRPFIFSFGFILTMGSIIVKTGRIVFIFVLAKGNRVVKLSNGRLLGMLMGMLLVDAIFLFGAAFVDPLKDTIYTTDSTRYHVCHSETAEALIDCSIAYKIILVLVGLGLVVAGRNVPSTFNEVKALSFMAYTIATNSMIYILSGLVSNTPTASTIIMTFTMAVALFSTIGILVLYKFFVVLFRPEHNKVNTTATHGRATSTHKHTQSMKFGAHFTPAAPSNAAGAQ